MSLLPLLAAERDLRVNVESEVASSNTRVEAAKARLARADQLLRDQVGSLRARETAQEELALAETALAAAGARLDRINRAPLESDVVVTVPSPIDGIVRQWHAAPGQLVAAGAALFEVASLDPLWIRVPVYAGEIAGIAPDDGAAIRALNDPPTAPARHADRVAAPPSADAASSTVDLYFSLANTDRALYPGQKVSAALSLRGRESGTEVPWSAILYDIHGGAWVYEQTGPQTYARRRVEVVRVSGGAAIVSRGIRPGARIVKAGAAELFGTEFGPGK